MVQHEEPTGRADAARPAWDADGRAALAIGGADAREALAAFLAALLALALGDGDAPGGGTAAVPVSGRGADLGQAAGALAEDLLDQLQTFGAGLREARLDGLLRGEAGVWAAWGYLVGNADAGPPREMAVDGPVEATPGPGGSLRLAATLVRR